MTPAISQEADDLIIACEVGSKAQYEKKYRHPEWPGGRSGVTIGLGYDLGFADHAKIDRDWSDRLPRPMVLAMVPCLGVTGEAAHAMLATVRNEIDVPWDDAAFVYEHHDIPEWTERVCTVIPGAEKLHPHCLGALTSIAYNRGASFKNTGDRYKEMRAVRSHIIAGELSLVDDEIRAMKRLWPGANERGLLIRRDKEADLWNKGLSSPVPLAPPKSKPSEAPAPLVRPQDKPGSTGPGVGGTLSTTTAAAAAQGFGYGPYIVGGVILAGVIVTAGVIGYREYQKRQPTLARAKG